MLEYMSVAEAAQKYNISERRVQILCEQGRLNGAKVLSGVWIIPISAEKPVDARTKAARDVNQLSLFDENILSGDLITLDEVCKILSISEATGRNWVRLSKITPLDCGKKPLVFSRDSIINILNSIRDSDSKMLKSRRNKKKISGNKIYYDYISGKENIEAVGTIIDKLPQKITESHIRVILANVILQFALQTNGVENEFSTNLIQRFLSNGLQLKLPESLINDMIGELNFSPRILSELEDALIVRFVYSPYEDVLGLLYMSLQNMGNKKSSGAYYTPAKIVKQLIKTVKDTIDITNKTCLDPCCGSGNFLLCFADAVNSPEQVYGQDNDPLAVFLTRANFALKYNITDTEFLCKHFTIGNSLNSIPNHQCDIILGNPPWGYEFTEDEIKTLRKKYKTASINGTESYDLFVEKTLTELKPNGLLAFVLPEAILNVKSHETVRKIMIEEGTFSFASYVGNVFSDVQCPAIILGISKEKSNKKIKIFCDGQEYEISGEQAFTAQNINLRSSDKSKDCLIKIVSASERVYLKDNATFALGIVTGNNKLMILDTQEEGSEVILKGSDIRKYTWNPSGHYIRFLPKEFQQVAPTEYYRAPEKLLYRFICETPVFAYDDKKTLTLNSCNILIPKFDDLSIKYILAILNSRVVDFFCKQTFNSIKLLRSHIEQIPIPIPNKAIQRQIVSYVESVLNDRTSLVSIYEEIDNIVFDLYGLISTEKDLILSKGKGRNLFLS